MLLCKICLKCCFNTRHCRTILTLLAVVSIVTWMTVTAVFIVSYIDDTFAI